MGWTTSKDNFVDFWQAHYHLKGLDELELYTFCKVTGTNRQNFPLKSDVSSEVQLHSSDKRQNDLWLPERSFLALYIFQTLHCHHRWTKLMPFLFWILLLLVNDFWIECTTKFGLPCGDMHQYRLNSRIIKSDIHKVKCKIFLLYQSWPWRAGSWFVDSRSWTSDLQASLGAWRWASLK